MRNTNKAPLAFFVIAAGFTATLGGIIFIVKLGNAIIDSISRTWDGTATMITLLAFFGILAAIIGVVFTLAINMAGKAGNGGGEKWGNGNANTYPVIDGYATPALPTQARPMLGGDTSTPTNGPAATLNADYYANID